MPQRKGWQRHLLYPPTPQPYRLAGPNNNGPHHPFPSPHPPSSSIKQWGQSGAPRPALPVNVRTELLAFSPVHAPLPNSSERVPASYDNIIAESESEVDSEADPFHDIPELGDFNLSGAGVQPCPSKNIGVYHQTKHSLCRDTQQAWRLAAATGD
ncbi:hypothetical protein ACOMHN_043821 [Nucella lapillus]